MKLLIAIFLACATTLALADASDPDPWAFKLSSSYYASSQQLAATDVNLRAKRESETFWLGHYQRGSEFEQTRVGYEHAIEFANVQIVPSLQLASKGFIGGSLNAQVGNDSVYGIVGLGRTNLKDYYNLNFDPNDAVTFGIGTKRIPGADFSIFTVQDNRLGTGQTVIHALWRQNFDRQRRLTVDVSHKRGRPDETAPSVAGNAVSVTLDERDVFVRLAREQKANFLASDQTRLSFGLRF